MYQGSIAIIPLGTGGLRSDDPQTAFSPSDLILANNVQLGLGMIEKEAGSIRYNSTVVPGGVKAVHDWWPDAQTQRLILVGGNGKIYKMTNYKTLIEVTPTGAAPATIGVTNQIHIFTGGMESEGNPKKIFVFNGKDPPQVITGDQNTRHNIGTPALDWGVANQPSFGFIHGTRIIALGGEGSPYRFYVSTDSDHENFTGLNSASYSVYPGEGDRLFSGIDYKGRAFLFKYPLGVYYIDDSAGGDITTWIPQKLTAASGVASAHPAVQVLDDLLIANSTGSITSFAATQAFGDIKAGDILTNLRAEQFMRDNMSPSGTLDRWAAYYEDKTTGFFTWTRLLQAGRESHGARKTNRLASP